MPLVVHPHFHRRYSGATRHVEDILPALEPHLEARAMGWLRRDTLPRITARELLRRARTEPLVWHAHRINELLAGLALRLVGKAVRVIWTRHGIGRPAGFTRLIARRADEIVSVSPESAETLGLPSKVIGHGVDLRRFSPPVDREATWQSLGLGGRLGIGVVGRVRPDKGQGEFVSAVAPLLGRYPDWRAVLVGLAKAEDRQWIDGAIAAAGAEIALAGEQPDVERWFQGLSVTVIPSHVESFGLTRIEAMAAGSCLVTTRLNAMDRELEHGRTAFLFDAGDTRALGEILEHLMREPGLARRVGLNAAELARSRFGIELEAEALRELYAAGLQSR